MINARNRHRSAALGLLGMALMLLGQPGVALADEPPPAGDPITAALQEMEQVDWNNRWVGYGMALVGSATGVGIAGWALYEQPLAADGHPDPVVLISSLTLAGAATSQVVHGGMRLDERIRGATRARELLAAGSDQREPAMNFLRERARQGRSTRFWGGVMTTTQGLGTTILGARLWAEGQDEIQTTGIVLTVMGALNTAIGALHFFGLPRPEKILRRTEEALEGPVEVQLRPTAVRVGHQRWAPGLTATGRF